MGQERDVGGEKNTCQDLWDFFIIIWQCVKEKMTFFFITESGCEDPNQYGSGKTQDVS